MKRKRRIPGILVKLVILVIVLLFLPQLIQLAGRLIADPRAKTEHNTAVIRQYLKSSNRLETLILEEEGTIESETKVIILGTIGSKKIDYRYRASIGIDLTAVRITAEENTIQFHLPEPEILNDGIEILRTEEHSFWSHAVDEKTETILAVEKNRIRERILSDPSTLLKIRDSTHSAFEETIIHWMEFSQTDPFEYRIIDHQDVSDSM